MARFEWKADLATGNARVDGQHRQIIEFANRFLEASGRDGENDDLEETFDRLERYARQHFADEEQLFLAIGSRWLDAQRAQHAQMRDELSGIRSLWRSNFGFVAEINRALEGWLETRLLPHIFEQDRQAFAERQGPPSR